MNCREAKLGSTLISIEGVMMAVFFVLASTDPLSVEGRILNKIPPYDFFRVDNQSWLVNKFDANTPKDLSDTLGIADGTCGRVLILPAFAGYFGHHNREMWSWLTSKGV